jgi:hypothetical protein
VAGSGVTGHIPRGLAVLAAVCSIAPGAAAQNPAPSLRELYLTPSYCLAPSLDYVLGLDLEYDRTTDRDKQVTNSLYPTLEPFVAVAPVDHLRFIGDFVLEPVIDEELGEDYLFSGLGAYVAQLYAQVESGAFNLQAGKIHIPFGEAWDVTPGLFAEIPGSYEIDERIGANAGYDFSLLGFGCGASESSRTVTGTPAIVEPW